MSWVTVAVAGANAFNQVQQGRWASDQAGLQAMQSEFKAKQELQAAETMAGLIRKAGRRQVGQTLTAYAGAGVKVGEGSALEAERQINLDVENDAFQTLLMGQRAASGLELDAKLTRIQGRMAKTASYMQAANTLISGAQSGLQGWRTAESYNYNGDASGAKFSATGDATRARR